MKKNNRLPYVAFGIVCLLWGTTYLAIRIGVSSFPPILFSAIRLSVAGALLFAILKLTGKWKKPSRKILLLQSIAGVLLFSLGNGLVTWAEVNISSSLAAIIASMIPVWVILVNLGMNRNETPTFPVIAGTIIGMGGILLIFGEHANDFSNPAYIGGILLTFTAGLSWAVGSVWIKNKNLIVDPMLSSSLQMFFGGTFLFPISFFAEDWSSFHLETRSILSLVYLILFGSIVAYVAYLYAIRKLPVTIVSMYAYINPIVAVLLGWVVLGEKLNPIIFAGILVTLVGIFIVNKGYQLRDLWKAQLS